MQEILLASKKTIHGYAKRFYKKYKKYNTISHNDIVGMGYVGLIESINSYNKNKNIDFQTFSKSRIKGSIIDGINQFLEIDKKEKYRIRLVNMDDENINNIKDQNIRNIHYDIYENEIMKIIYNIAEINLSPKEKEAFYNKYQRDMKNCQISRKMNITKQRVNVLIERSIQKIKNNLRKNYARINE